MRRRVCAPILAKVGNDQSPVGDMRKVESISETDELVRVAAIPNVIEEVIGGLRRRGRWR